MTPRDSRPVPDAYPCAPRDVVQRWEEEWSPLRRRLRDTGKPGPCA